MESNDIICKNCNQHFAGKFCNSCGQKAETNRISWKEIFHHLHHAIGHLDSGFFFTIKQLASRPGFTIREYLEGKRKPHYNPFLLLLILAGLGSYLLVHFKVQTVFSSVEIDKLELEKPFIAHKYFAVRNILFCIICCIGDYFFFRKSRLTLPETFVANVFMFSGVSMLHLVFFPILLAGKQLDVLLYAKILFIIGAFLYLFIARYQLYAANGSRKLMYIIGVALLTYVAIFTAMGNLLIKPMFGN